MVLISGLVATSESVVPERRFFRGIMTREIKDVTWIEEAVESTSLPAILKESNEIGTVVIFVISAVLTITLLFIIAIFIDCRQQKLIDSQKPQRTTSRLKRLKLPTFGRRQTQEDEDSIVDKIQEAGPSNVIV